jgi:chemotaxis protein CheX
MNQSKLSPILLLVDDGAVDPAIFQEAVVEKLIKKNIHLSVVIANSGANASAKLANQKFDAVVVNLTVPRLQDSGLQYQLESASGGFSGPIYVLGNLETKKTNFNLSSGKPLPLPLDPQKLVEALIADLSCSKAPAGTSKYVVDVRVINAIIASTVKVLGQFNMKSITMGKAEARGLQEPMGGVISSVLEIVSVSFCGQLSVSFDEASFLEMASGMLCEEQTSINEENWDAVGELNNIIFGNAKPDLANYGVELAIPTVVMGAGQIMECPAGSAALRVPFQTLKGRFFIDLIAYPSVS